jgi:hypothetical protein
MICDWDRDATRRKDENPEKREDDLDIVGRLGGPRVHD